MMELSQKQKMHLYGYLADVRDREKSGQDEEGDDE